LIKTISFVKNIIKKFNSNIIFEVINMNENTQLPSLLLNQIEKLNENQLRYLNHIIIERIKLIHGAKALQALSKFNIGDAVSFDHYGETIKGRIIRINQKTLSIITLDQKGRWKVSPVFLKKEESEQYAESSKIVESQYDLFGDEEENDDDENNNPVMQVINPENKISRNSPCPCGSGKKYKKCCLK
jgi:hypothetical protein